MLDARPSSSPTACSGGAWSNVEVSPTAGHPIVYADWLHAEGAPTVLVYCHYDVQPVDPLDLWVRAAVRAAWSRTAASTPAAPRTTRASCTSTCGRPEPGWRRSGRLPINVRYVFEGEEESGSTNFDDWLVANRHRLAADVAVISDTGFFEGNLPAITSACAA